MSNNKQTFHLNLSDQCDISAITGLSGAKLYVHDDSDQHVSKVIKEQGIWEAYETQLVIEHVKSGDIFLDIGANIGYYSVVAGFCVGDKGKVFSFEPERQNFQLLKNNIALNQLSCVAPFPVALSNERGEGKIYLNETNWGDHQIYDDTSGRESYGIQLENGYELLKDQCERVNFIKIDTQGAEYSVLTGLLPLIEKSLPNLTMIVEFWPKGLNRSVSSDSDQSERKTCAHRLLDLLLSFDLSMFIIDHINHGLIPCTEKDIRDWISDVETNPENEGFINLLLKPSFSP